METNVISAELFKKRLVDLCVRGGLTGLPRKEQDRHILFKSIVLNLKRDRSYTDSEINDALRSWIVNIGDKIEIDHVLLRRSLVDENYLERESDGSAYRMTDAGNTRFSYDNEIDQIDIPELIIVGRELLERKKREYMERNR